MAGMVLASCASTGPQAPGEGPCVVFVTIDGFRWQEVFEGAEERLMSKQEGGVVGVAALKKEFWRETPEARREALLPFIWGAMAREGQILGNGKKGAAMAVTNGLKFSYPGYAEMLCGFADPRVDSNKRVPNPNPTVLEWLNGRPGLQGRVAAFCTWDVFLSIFNADRCGFPVHYGPQAGDDPRLAALYGDVPTLWDGVVLDALEFHAAMDYVRAKKPRVLYLGFGETDEWAHEGRYDLYLQAARRCDAMLKRLWEELQSMPEYRGRTTLIVTADHGRGDAPTAWKSHGAKVEGAEFVWLAAMGPGVAATGERSGVTGATQNRIAASIAAAVGEDYAAAVPKAAPSLPFK